MPLDKLIERELSKARRMGLAIEKTVKDVKENIDASIMLMDERLAVECAVSSLIGG
jgi:RNase H-fold protein (predicted Holliday junction resolvase)